MSAATDGFEEARQRAVKIGRTRNWADIKHAWAWTRFWDPPFYAQEADDD